MDIVVVVVFVALLIGLPALLLSPFLYYGKKAHWTMKEYAILMVAAGVISWLVIAIWILKADFRDAFRIAAIVLIVGGLFARLLMGVERRSRR